MTLPASKTIGDTGHVSDHNAIVAHIAAHEANVTDAHDIDGLIETHRADTTNVHGISNTAPIEGAWTSWTPSITAGITTPTASGAYRLIGKTLEFRLAITGGTGQSGTTITVTLPASLSAIVKQFIHGVYENSGGPTTGVKSYASGTSFTLTTDSGINFSGNNFATYPYRASGTIEVA